MNEFPRNVVTKTIAAVAGVAAVVILSTTVAQALSGITLERVSVEDAENATALVAAHVDVSSEIIERTVLERSRLDLSNGIEAMGEVESVTPLLATPDVTVVSLDFETQRCLAYQDSVRGLITSCATKPDVRSHGLRLVVTPPGRDSVVAVLLPHDAADIRLAGSVKETFAGDENARVAVIPENLVDTIEFVAG